MAPSSLPSLALAILLIVLSTTQLPSSLGAASGSHHHDLVMLDRFHRWMSAHGRSYGSADEKLRRLEVYRRNVEFIEASNRDAETLGYELGENMFTDLTNEEFVARYASGGTRPSLAENGMAVGDGDGDDDMVITTLAGNIREGHGQSNIVVPVSFDWRAKGAVSPAKYQGACGACWAFATVSVVESLIKIKGGSLLDLSEQELVDCSGNAFSTPCVGSWPRDAMPYIVAKGGLVSETAYPYVEKRGSCKDTKGAVRMGKITGFKEVQWHNETALVMAVLERPVAVNMDGSGDVLQHYKSGIYRGPCKGAVNHVVVFVGWGVDAATGDKYWIAKNSWSELWGQKGFFFMRKEADGTEGLCKITQVSAVYPVM